MGFETIDLVSLQGTVSIGEKCPFRKAYRKLLSCSRDAP
jgi:hypothetical protein